MRRWRCRRSLCSFASLGLALAVAGAATAGPFFRSSASDCAQPVVECESTKVKKKFGPKDPPIAPVVGVFPAALINQTVVPVAPSALPAANPRDEQIDRLLRLLELVEATNTLPAPAAPAAAVPAPAPVVDLELQRDLQMIRLLLQEMRKQP